MKEKINHNFTPTKWSSVDDKEKFYNHFIKFVGKDFPPGLFHKWFYKRLSMCFGFIAHYNSYGFSETFFRSTRDKLEFIKKILTYPCYGDPVFTYSDVEKELKNWLIQEEILNKLQERLDTEVINTEYFEYQRLKAKFENA